MYIKDQGLPMLNRTHTHVRKDVDVAIAHTKKVVRPECTEGINSDG